MKKLSINLFIVLALALSTVSTTMPQTTWQKIKSFAARNKGKIIALGVAAIAAGIGVAAAKVVKDKADKAIEQAGISKDGPDYQNALILLTTVGNLPQENAIKFMVMYFDERELLQLYNRNVIKALAYYWDEAPAVLYGKLGLKLTVAQAKELAQEVTDAIHQGFNKLRSAFGYPPREKTMWEKLTGD